MRNQLRWLGCVLEKGDGSWIKRNMLLYGVDEMRG